MLLTLLLSDSPKMHAVERSWTEVIGSYIPGTNMIPDAARNVFNKGINIAQQGINTIYDGARYRLNTDGKEADRIVYPVSNSPDEPSDLKKSDPLNASPELETAQENPDELSPEQKEKIRLNNRMKKWILKNTKLKNVHKYHQIK